MSICSRRPGDRLLYNENEATSTVRSLEETEFYKKQLRIALRNWRRHRPPEH